MTYWERVSCGRCGAGAMTDEEIMAAGELALTGAARAFGITERVEIIEPNYFKGETERFKVYVYSYTAAGGKKYEMTFQLPLDRPKEWSDLYYHFNVHARVSFENALRQLPKAAP